MNGYTPPASSPDSFSYQGRRVNREKYLQELTQRQKRIGSPIRDPSAHYASHSPILNRVAAGDDECLASPPPARRRHTYPGNYSVDNSYSPNTPSTPACPYSEEVFNEAQPSDYTPIHHSARGSWAPVRRIDFDQPEESDSPLQNQSCMGNQSGYMDPAINYGTPQDDYSPQYDMRRNSSPALNGPSPGNNLAPPPECFNNPRYPGETPIHYPIREGVNPCRRIDFDEPEETDLPKPDPSCFRNNQGPDGTYTSPSVPGDDRFGFNLPQRRPVYRPPEEPQCFTSPRNYPASETFSPSALEAGYNDAAYGDYTPIHYSMKGSRRPKRRINMNASEDQNYYPGPGSPENLIDFNTSCPTPQSALNHQQMNTPIQPMRQDLIDFNTSCPAPPPCQVDRRFPTVSAPGLPSPMQPCRKGPNQRPKLNLNEREANETLDEMIDTTIKGFDRIAKSLKKKPNLRNLSNLPTDRDKLNEVLLHSIKQTESSLSLLRQGMQDTLLEMTRILAKRTALQVPEIINLVSDFEKRKCERQGQLVDCPKDEPLSSAPSTSQEKPAEGAEAIAPKEEGEVKKEEEEKEKEEEGE